MFKTLIEMNENRFLAAVAVAFFFTQGAALMLAPLLVDIAAGFDVSVAVAFSAIVISVFIRGSALECKTLLNEQP